MERLGARLATTRTSLCLGLDPDPQALPAGFGSSLEGLERFSSLLIAEALPFATALKVNLAFYEAFGSRGLAALERLRADVPEDVPVILDAKRGDVASTSRHHAAALFDVLGADAVTASPYLGADAIEPLLERADRFVYVLCRTSNPGAAEFQSLAVAGGDGAAEEPLYLRVARRATEWSDRYGTVGLVVGATAPADLQAAREAAPELPFLVPGVGAQGGEITAVVGGAPARAGMAATLPGGGCLVNVSRGIASVALASELPAGPEGALQEAARSWAARLQVLR
ncbi:MAG: orotidine-5'-phosphate decarboxylase [Candidatus Limnocylindrales bacterium]